jgi:methylmalonyl-CoA mutase, C-terminal domain
MMPQATARPIRVLIAKPGLDGHDVGAKIVCRALTDAGMEAIYTGLRQSPAQIAAAALKHDVDCLGLSVLSGAHVSLTAKVAAELDRVGLFGDVLWLVGGNIPKSDVETLTDLGVNGVFPTGADFGELVQFIEQAVAERREA